MIVVDGRGGVHERGALPSDVARRMERFRCSPHVNEVIRRFETFYATFIGKLDEMELNAQHFGERVYFPN